MIWTEPEWVENARTKWYDPQLDTFVELEAPIYGWRFATTHRFKLGQIETLDIASDPLKRAYRIYEHIYDAIEELSGYCERVEMSQLARIRLGGYVYRPAKRASPYRVFHGTNFEILWTANPTEVLHQFAFECIQDILREYPRLEDFIAIKKQYLLGLLGWQRVHEAECRLRRIQDVLTTDARYAVYHLLLDLGLEGRHGERAVLETELQNRLLALRPEGMQTE